jgi:hypothetical protein
MGSIGEFYNDSFLQFSKLSSPFKLSCVQDTFIVSDVRQTIGPGKNGFKLDEVLSYLDSHDVVFFGKIATQNEFNTNTEIVDNSNFYSFDQKQNVFVNLKDGKTYTEKNIFSLIYFFKINSTNAYMMILNSLVNLELAGNGSVQSHNNLVVSDHGNSVRSKLANLKFSPNINVINNDRALNTFMLHMKDGMEGTIKLFGENPYYQVTEEFISGFDMNVESNLQHSRVKDEIKFTRTDEKFGYIKINLAATKLFNSITEGNVFERLEFIFYIF